GRHRPRGSGNARAGHAHRRRAAGWAALHVVELRVLEARADHGRGLRMERAPDAAHRRREGLGSAAECPPALVAPAFCSQHLCLACGWLDRFPQAFFEKCRVRTHFSNLMRSRGYSTPGDATWKPEAAS